MVESYGFKAMFRCEIDKKGRLAMTNINSTESKISKKTNLWVYLMREFVG